MKSSASLVEDEWPPKSCQMPDLSGLDGALSLTLLLNRAFAKGGPADTRAFGYVMNFVRITDKVVRCYEATRYDVVSFVDSPNNVLGPLFVATGFAETCITSMMRTVKLGRALRKHKFAPPMPKPILIFGDMIANRINRMRVAIEHIDGPEVSTKWKPNYPLCLLLKSDRMELLDEQILYSELAEWVKELHSVASRVAQFTQP